MFGVLAQIRLSNLSTDERALSVKSLATFADSSKPDPDKMLKLQDFPSVLVEFFEVFFPQIP